ncbi:MAG: serine--tRNA ligase, partial [Acidobacteria bacterium]|nr:serine--tRNA ligase [Acidobacteriota bacterium]
MHDLAFVRDHLPLVEEKLRQRGLKPEEVLKDFPQFDAERRRLITETETLQAERNRASEEVARLKKDKRDATFLIERVKGLRARVETLDKRVEEKEQQMRALLAGIPNLPHESVPVGDSPEQNQEVRRWGALPQFSFAPKPHWELGELLGVLDLARAAKLSGARFAVYWDLGARLERALAAFMLDLHTREHGY